MAMLIKNTAGPDPIGGFFPQSDAPVVCINRSGATLSLGECAMLDLEASATEILTSDSNSYLPGVGDASGDTVWHTVVNPSAGMITNGGILGIALEDVLDNETGEFQFYGIVNQAFVIRAGIGSTEPMGPLTPAAANNLDAVVGATERVVAWYLSPEDDTLTTRELKRVFLHNGVFGGLAGTATT